MVQYYGLTWAVFPFEPQLHKSYNSLMTYEIEQGTTVKISLKDYTTVVLDRPARDRRFARFTVSILPTTNSLSVGWIQQNQWNKLETVSKVGEMNCSVGLDCCEPKQFVQNGSVDEVNDKVLEEEIVTVQVSLVDYTFSVNGTQLVFQPEASDNESLPALTFQGSVAITELTYL